MGRKEREAVAKDWIKVAEDCLEAADELHRSGRFRSSISRSYYAAYSFLASLLVLAPGVTFRDDREGPEHEPLPDLVAEHLKKTLGPAKLKWVRLHIRMLYGERLLADYRPRASLKEERSKKALQDATSIAMHVRRSNS